MFGPLTCCVENINYSLHIHCAGTSTCWMDPRRALCNQEMNYCTFVTRACVCVGLRKLGHWFFKGRSIFRGQDFVPSQSSSRLGHGTETTLLISGHELLLPTDEENATFKLDLTAALNIAISYNCLTSKIPQMWVEMIQNGFLLRTNLQCFKKITRLWTSKQKMRVKCVFQ